MASKSVNRVELIGNVGKDPDVRSSGTTLVASFSVATSERAKDETGNWVDRTEWHNVVAFGRVAENVRDYVHKGSRVRIEGKLQTRGWDDRETGKKAYRTEVVAKDIISFDRNKEDSTYPPKSGHSSASYDQPRSNERDDIPF